MHPLEDVRSSAHARMAQMSVFKIIPVILVGLAATNGCLFGDDDDAVVAPGDDDCVTVCDNDQADCKVACNDDACVASCDSEHEDCVTSCD
jgi:hypothetical protein